MKLHTNSSSPFPSHFFDSRSTLMGLVSTLKSGEPGEREKVLRVRYLRCFYAYAHWMLVCSRADNHHFWYDLHFLKWRLCVCVYVCVWHRFFDYDPSSDLSVCPLAPPPFVPSLLFFMIFFIIRCLINFVINFIPVFHFVSIHPRSKVIGLIKRVNKWVR